MISPAAAIYLRTCQARNRKIVKLDGIILFPLIDTIPVNIIFFKTIIDESLSLEKHVQKTLMEYAEEGLLMYFQGVRWLDDDLLNQLNGLDYVMGEIDSPILAVNQIKITAGTIYFDQTNTDYFDFGNNPTFSKVSVIVDNKLYNLSIRNAPKELGIGKIFSTSIRLYLEARG